MSDGVNTNPVIFIVGNSRSGTTMMGRIFGLHSKVHTYQELHFFEQLWSASDADTFLDEKKGTALVSRLLNIERNGYFTKVKDEEYSEEAAQIINGTDNKEKTAVKLYADFLKYETAKHNKIISCKQTPQNVFYLSEILSIFPDSRVIIMVRDPKDVLVSQKDKWKRRKLGASAIPFSEAVRARFNYHPITISKLWNSAVNAGAKQLNDKRVKEIRYEDLIASPEQTIRMLCEFTGVSFEEGMLNVPHKGSSNAADSGSSGIKKDSVASWKNKDIGKGELYICQEITRTNRLRLAYPDVNLQKSFSVILWKIYWPISIIISLLFNLHRMKNIVSTIKKRIA